jgi:hypothetical protein
MKALVAAMIRRFFCFLVLIHTYVIGQDDLVNKVFVAVATPDMPNIFIAETSYGKFHSKIVSPILYLPKSGKLTVSGGFVKTALTIDGKNVEQTNGYFDVKPNPIKVKAIESKGYTIQPDMKNTVWIFDEVGTFDIAMAIGSEIVSIPIEVRQIPFEEGMDCDIVIKELGFPTRKTTHYVKWPSNEFVDGIFYSVSASESIISFEHWEYEKLPHCIFSVDDGKIRGVHSICIDPTDPIRFPQAYQQKLNQSYGKKSDDGVKQEKGNKNDADKVESDFRKWTNVNGKTVYAKLLRYNTTKVTLQLEDGKTIDLLTKQLIKSDIELAKKFSLERKEKSK